MAMTSNTVNRYDNSASIREDLSDMIYLISPTETPVMSSIGKDKAKNTYFEWQTDDLAAAVTTNAQFEGDDVVGTTEARADTNRVGNYAQISRKLVQVSGTVEALDKAGMRSQMAYQLQKASSEIKRDIEKTIMSIQLAVAGNTTVARKTAALPNWIITNFTAGGTTTTAPPQMSSGSATTNLSGYPTTSAVAGTTVTFTEAILKSMQQQVWTQGGKPDVLWAGPVNKAIVSTFTGIATRYKDVPGNKQAVVIGAADIYVGDFGTVTVVPDRFSNESIIILGDPDYASIAYVRPFETVAMAKTGDSEKRMLLAEWGLRVKAQKSFAAKWAATTS